MTGPGQSYSPQIEPPSHHGGRKKIMLLLLWQRGTDVSKDIAAIGTRTPAFVTSFVCSKQGRNPKCRVREAHPIARRSVCGHVPSRPAGGGRAKRQQNIGRETRANLTAAVARAHICTCMYVCIHIESHFVSHLWCQSFQPTCLPRICKQS